MNCLVRGKLWTVVNCSFKTLQFIPSNYSQTITKLILSNNLIELSSADEAALKNYSNLIELHLDGNWLTDLRVEPKALAGLVNLRELDLNSLKVLDLKGNPWNCSCVFLNRNKSITDSKVQISKHLFLSLFAWIVDNGTSCSSGPSSTTTLPPPTTQSTTKPTSAQTTTHSGPVSGSGVPVVGNTWKFLLGVVAIALTTSMLIVCAVKAPSWYKLLFNYRHQRLRDDEDADVYTTGRYSSFSLDTEQTETSAHELDHGLDGLDNEEDGYIEDRYIETGVYEDNR
uniref:LRRCT domain-containing protein n=1 Tax=Oncorhynchus mykiss TaxID=8022 RepID=A0A8K9V7U8_ONCMY